MPKIYGQRCPVAKTLELVGDRWTLLIVRDLLQVRDVTDTAYSPNVMSPNPTMLSVLASDAFFPFRDLGASDNGTTVFIRGFRSSSPR